MQHNNLTSGKSLSILQFHTVDLTSHFANKINLKYQICLYSINLVFRIYSELTRGTVPSSKIHCIKITQIKKMLCHTSKVGIFSNSEEIDMRFARGQFSKITVNCLPLGRGVSKGIITGFWSYPQLIVVTLLMFWIGRFRGASLGDSFCDFRIEWPYSWFHRIL